MAIPRLLYMRISQDVLSLILTTARDPGCPDRALVLDDGALGNYAQWVRRRIGPDKQATRKIGRAT